MITSHGTNWFWKVVTGIIISLYGRHA